MSNRVILVIVDGLAWSVACDMFGCVQAYREAGKATLYKLQSELPSLSRPLYECILTGTPPVASNVLHNQIVRLSNQQSIFHLAQGAGLRTAAAAYHWVSELYNCAPYAPVRDRFTENEHLPIQHGIFYHQDDYPDEHLFDDAEVLRQRHDPHFLLIHPMNVDDAGHRGGLNSALYRNAARRVDRILSEYLPVWLKQGYQILITSDHGMHDDGMHGGTLAQERDVPLFVLGNQFSHLPGLPVLQTQLCGVVADLLGLAHQKPRCLDLLAEAAS